MSFLAASRNNTHHIDPSRMKQRKTKETIPIKFYVGSRPHPLFDPFSCYLVFVYIKSPIIQMVSRPPHRNALYSTLCCRTRPLCLYLKATFCCKLWHMLCYLDNSQFTPLDRTSFGSRPRSTTRYLAQYLPPRHPHHRSRHCHSRHHRCRHLHCHRHSWKMRSSSWNRYS